MGQYRANDGSMLCTYCNQPVAPGTAARSASPAQAGQSATQGSRPALDDRRIVAAIGSLQSSVDAQQVTLNKIRWSMFFIGIPVIVLGFGLIFGWLNFTVKLHAVPTPQPACTPDYFGNGC